MSEADNFKNRYLQQPITFLTEENLDKLENHCKKAIHYERGVEHQVVLELLERYKEFLAEREEDKKRIEELKEQLNTYKITEYETSKKIDNIEKIKKEAKNDAIKEYKENLIQEISNTKGTISKSKLFDIINSIK